MKPSVSVIIPTWNRINVLPRALHSVCYQTTKPDEIIVVDDGSTDGTAEMVRSDYPQVSLLVQDNAGVSTARNTGISVSKCTWIAFLDSDDEWLPKKLEKQLKYIEESPEAVLVHTDEIWIRNGVRVNSMKKHEKSGGWIFDNCLPLCVISPSSAMIKKTLFAEIGMFDASLEVCEDYDLWLRICSKYPVHYLEEKLIVKYGGHEDQLSSKHWGMDRFRIHALEKIISEGDLSKKDNLSAVKLLVEKAEIIALGAEKRDKHELAGTYRKIAKRYTRKLVV